MRKYKEVKRKEVIYDLEEWKQVEKLASKVSMQTSEYIRRMSLNGKIICFDMSSIAPVLNAMRIVGNNINQIAKKANETNSIYAEDIENLRKENAEFCHILSQYLSIIQSIAA